LASGRYFVVEDAAGRVLGAGGYSLAALGPESGPAAAQPKAKAHIRHVATDPDVTRQGIGRQLMQAIFAAADAEGIARYDCLSTLTAVPFYEASGFGVLGPVQIPMLAGLRFPAIRMSRSA
jgi:GNAT superfamily N-acetyltransferase